MALWCNKLTLVGSCRFRQDRVEKGTCATVSIDRRLLSAADPIREMDLQPRGTSLDYVVHISEQGVPRKGVFQVQICHELVVQRCRYILDFLEDFVNNDRPPRLDPTTRIAFYEY